MEFYDTDRIHTLVDMPGLVSALHTTFSEGGNVPPRPHYTLPTGGTPGTLLLMPAWQGGLTGVKVVTVHPDNGTKGLPAVFGTYLLLDGETGQPRAVLDGTALTRLRTAAASALAARFLAKEDAATLLMVGAGALAPYLIRAHASVRPIRRVLIWNRHPARAHRLARSLASEPFEVSACEDLAGAAPRADVISCATLSHEPLIRGRWLREGAHLDLVGGYTPEMREADDDAVLRARLFVDTRDGALREAGDLVQPIEAGLITPDTVAADLFDLCGGRHPGRLSSRDITLFKSVGTALEDLAAARLVLDRAERGN